LRRESLRPEVRSPLDWRPLRLAGDFHATLLGCVAGQNGGYFFHIAMASLRHEAQDLSSFVLSRPENGPYAETTFFFTEADCQDI